jgi:hypothetical protein
MGLFSGIKKAVKGVFKGIKKVFGGVMKAYNKFAGSKLGKMVMLAAAIYTGGLAISGGIQAWSAASAAEGATFMSKFVAGAEGFMTTLFNPIDATKTLMDTGAPLTAGQLSAIAPNAATEAAGQIANAATQTAESSAIQTAAQGGVTTAPGPPSQLPSFGGAGAMPGTGNVAPSIGSVAKTAAETAAQPEGWLSKAAGFAKDFLMSPTGASMIEGYAMGGAQEEQQKFDDRINRQWNDPNNAFQQQMKGGGMLSGTIQRGGSPKFTPGGNFGGSSIASTSGALPGEPLPA